MRRFAIIASAMLLAGMGLLPAPITQSNALADTGVDVTEKCRLSRDSFRMNVLMLLDASKSLARTDPGNARRDGLEAAVRNLADLALSSPEADIHLAVDTFATGYERQHGWTDAVGARGALAGGYGSITSLPGPGVITYTDYRQAVRGAAERFRDAPGNCNLLLWFTDGEHATQGSSSDVSDAEWAQLRELCRSQDMQQLAERGVWSLAVLLSSPSSTVGAAPLQQLFGVGASPCRHALDGDIRFDISADDLSDALGELIAEIVWEGETEADTEDDLPGEPDGPPDQEAYQRCSGGDATADRPCQYRFDLDEGVDSFRVFVNMTYLSQGIRNPSAVNMVLQSPSGARSEPIVSVAPIDGLETTRYQPVRPFWFLSHRPYDSRWEIIGHQAAQQLAGAESWEWVGEWTLLFWGETAESVEDAAKVATAFRAVTTDAPSARIRISSERGDLVGFIEDFPRDYSSAELRLRLDDRGGAPVYPTRPYLKCRQVECDPLAVSGADAGRRFAVPGAIDEILWWDSAEAGGNGLELSAALDARGPVSAAAVMEQKFLYGGADGYGPGGERGRPLSWVRDIGKIGLDLAGPIIDEEGVEDAKDKWDDLKDEVGAMETGLLDVLPVGLELHDPPYEVDGDRVVFRVRIGRGYFPGLLTLERVTSQVEGDAAGAARYDRGWQCAVPGVGDGSTGSGEPVTCGAIPVDLRLSEDATVTVEMDFGIALAGDWPDLEEAVRSTVSYEGTWQSWSPADEEWAALWERLQQAAAPRSESRESRPFIVDLPTTGDKLGGFWPILVLLVGLALLLRVFAAWRLRPWSPLVSPQYLVKQLDRGEDVVTGSALAAERELCMDLTRRSASARVSGVFLFSMWRPLLIGGPPRLAAKSSGRQCVGIQGSIRTRRQRQREEHSGLVGHGLRDGWVVEMSPAGDRLIVWDLPDSEAETFERLVKAESEAAYRLDRLRAEVPEEGDAELPNASVADPEAAEHEDADPFGGAPRPDPFGD